MIPFQRVMALLMAAALVFFFLVPLARARHEYTLIYIVIGVFVMYLAVNAWIWKRMRS